MELDEAIKKRRSCRSFKDKKADWRVAIDGIEAACQAPFAGNNNHLKFVIIEDPRKIKQLAENCDQSWVQDVGLVVVIVSNEKNLEHMYGEQAKIYGRQQAGAAIQNFLLKVTDLGLGTCWIGSYDEDLILSRIGAPNYMHIEAILPIGYPQSIPKGKEEKILKKSINSAVYWEQWAENRRQHMFIEPERHTTPVVFGQKGKNSLKR